MGHLREWLSGCVYGAEHLLVQLRGPVRTELPPHRVLAQKETPLSFSIGTPGGRRQTTCEHGAGGGEAQVPAYCGCHPSPNPHHPPAAGAGP